MLTNDYADEIDNAMERVEESIQWHRDLSGAPDRHALRELYDQAIAEIGKRRSGISLTSGFYAKIADSVFYACYLALSDYAKRTRRLNVVSAPSGGGKTSFSFAFMVALTRLAERNPDMPAGCVFVVDQIKKADDAYRELNALMPGKVHLWTSEHDKGAKNRTRVIHPAVESTPDELSRFPIIIVTHAFYSGINSHKARFWSPDGDAFNDYRRALTIVDERPEEVEIFETTLREAHTVKEAATERLPEILGHIERLILLMTPHDLNARSQRLRIPDGEATSVLGWFTSDQAERIARSYTSSIPGIDGLFGFARAMTLGCSFAAPAGNVVSFIGWQPKLFVQPGTVLLDATADIDGMSQICPWRENISVPQASYDNLEIVHVPQHTGQNLRDHFKMAANKRHYVSFMLDTIKAHMKPGERGLVVCKKILFDDEYVPNWGQGDPRFDNPTNYTEGYGWDVEGRKLCATHWGTGIGSNSWRDADVVFLFDQFYLPKTVAVATVQGLRGHRANEGDLVSMTTIRSKAPGVQIISAGHNLRWLKQIALRGRGRSYDANGVCGKQRLVVSCDPKAFLGCVELLFPSAKVRVVAAAGGKTTLAASLIQALSRPDLPAKVSAAEVGRLIERRWGDVSTRVLTPEFIRSLQAIGWRYVQVRGRGGSYFERMPDEPSLAA
jgi:hypothetical protein